MRPLLRSISSSFALQILLQCINFSCAILLIRLLSKDQYALYTVAFAVLSTLNILSESGLGFGLMSEGGRVAEDANKLSSVILSGIQIRKSYSKIMAIVGAPVLLAPLFKLSPDRVDIFILSGLVLILFWVSWPLSVLEVAPKLDNRSQQLQILQITNGITKIGLLLLALAHWPTAIVAFLILILLQGYLNVKLWAMNKKYIKEGSHPDVATVGRLSKITRRLFPSALYFAFSGQITIWLAALLGNSYSVASIGALTRYGVSLNLVSSVYSLTILPRFSRLSSAAAVWIRFKQIQFLAGFIVIVVVALSTILAQPLLMLLGEQYLSARIEFIMVMAISGLSFASGVSFSLASARGHVMSPILEVGSNIAVQLACVVLINLQTLRGILLVGLISATYQYCLFLIYSAGVLKIDKNIEADKVNA